MSHAATTDTIGTRLSAVAISIIRTVVPAAWGSLFGWLVLQIPALETIKDQVSILGELVTLILIGLWYAGARWVEPRLPNLFRVIILGAAVAPAGYVSQPDQAAVVPVPADEVAAVLTSDGAVVDAVSGEQVATDEGTTEPSDDAEPG